ncbi:unnamed protein product [Caretta caretta]
MATWSEAVLLARLNQGVSEISPSQEKSSAERVGDWHDGAPSALQLTQRFEISGRECAECKGLITQRLPECFTAITPDPAASPAPASGWASAMKLAPVTGSTGRFAEAAQGTPPPQPPAFTLPQDPVVCERLSLITPFSGQESLPGPGQAGEISAQVA